MTESATDTPTDAPHDTPRTPPFRIRDDDGDTVTVARASDADEGDIDDFYAAFPASDRAQGVPPARPDERREWVATLLTGDGVVARRNGRVVGHAALLPGGDGHELAIFVAADARGVGVGTALLAGLLGAHRGGRIWLSVEPSNRRARALYRRFGFEPIERGRFEMTMER